MKVCFLKHGNMHDKVNSTRWFVAGKVGAWLGIRSRQAQSGRHKRQTKKLSAQVSNHPTTRAINHIDGGWNREHDGLSIFLRARIFQCLWTVSRRLSIPNVAPTMSAVLAVVCCVGPAGTNDDLRRLFFPPPRNNVDLGQWPCCLKMLESQLSSASHTPHSLLVLTFVRYACLVIGLLGHSAGCGCC